MGEKVGNGAERGHVTPARIIRVHSTKLNGLRVGRDRWARRTRRLPSGHGGPSGPALPTELIPTASIFWLRQTLRLWIGDPAGRALAAARTTSITDLHPSHVGEFRQSRDDVAIRSHEILCLARIVDDIVEPCGVGR